MKLIYRISGGQTYESPEMSKSEAIARLQDWERAWSSGQSMRSVTTFREAVIASAHIVAVEAPGMDEDWRAQ